MSILIKDMEMPKRCEECRFYGVDCDAGCWLEKQFVIRKFKQGKPDWCPLVEVPTPHGDLIDRGELEVIFNKPEGVTYVGDYIRGLDAAMNIVDAQPTIIEAEE